LRNVTTKIYHFAFPEIVFISFIISVLIACLVGIRFEPQRKCKANMWSGTVVNQR
jgi:hypothetical protein